MFIRHAVNGRRLIANAADDHGTIDGVTLTRANTAILVIQPHTLHANALHFAIALNRDRGSKKVEIDADGFIRAKRLWNGYEFAQMRNGLANAGFQQRIFADVWQIILIDARGCPLQMRKLAEFLGRHRNLVRATPAQDGDVLNSGMLQHIERVADNVRAVKFGTRFGQYARDIQRDVAVTDNDDMPSIQWRLKVRIIRVAIIPADKGGAAKNAGQICASDVQRAIIRRAGGENDRVI